MRHLITALIVAVIPAATSAAQPIANISLPRLEAGAAVTYAFDDARPAASHTIGAVLALSANLNPVFAVTGEAALGGHMRALAAGTRVSTGFYREANSTGRFFAQALVGRFRRGGEAGTTTQVGAGADVLVAPRGLSLHWELDYWLAPRAVDRHGARFSVGVVFGPRRTAPSGGPPHAAAATSRG